MAPPRVAIVGAGKVGRALAEAARREGLHATLSAARGDARRSMAAPDLVVVAVRGDRIAEVAASVARRLRVAKQRRVVFAHTAGAHDAEILAGLREQGFEVAQMHPLCSFVGHSVELRGATLLVGGDARAVRTCKRFGRALGMVPRELDGLDRASYHAAAALAANGSAALAAAACEILVAAGVPRNVAPSMIGPLLATVAANLTHVGLPGALSGPVRRGDVTTVEAHLSAVGRLGREQAWVPRLYRASVQAQLGLARAIGEADADGLAVIHALVSRPETE